MPPQRLRIRIRMSWMRIPNRALLQAVVRSTTASPLPMGGKTISQYGETDFLKFSNGVQYTVSGIPSGETVESVVFYGYPHEAGNQCYIAEFNGVNEDPSANSISPKLPPALLSRMTSSSGVSPQAPSPSP